jgi:hypothetical protein
MRCSLLLCIVQCVCICIVSAHVCSAVAVYINTSSELSVSCQRADVCAASVQAYTLQAAADSI